WAEIFEKAKSVTTKFKDWVQVEGERLDHPANSGKDERTVSHSPDFRSVCWFGTEYSFTADQAAIVKILWEAWGTKAPDIGQETLKIGAEVQSRLVHLFKNHPAWKKFIVKGGTRGTFRLNPPA